jgi:adenylate cyclase
MFEFQLRWETRILRKTMPRRTSLWREPYAIRCISIKTVPVYLCSKVQAMIESQVNGIWTQLKKRKLVKAALTYFSSDHIESTFEGDDGDTDAPSIAVLPFRDTSEQGKQGYFCYGIAEEILNALTRYTRLRVAARIMSFQFGGEQADVEEIGKKLKVQSVLLGSVDKSGDHLRIQGQLVNTGAGAILWSGEFDRRLQDVFDIHDDIVNSVCTTLGVALDSDYNVIRHQVDPKAYDFFLRGLALFAKHTTQDNVYARQMFKRAIEIEPDYGRAWSSVAYSHGIEYMYFNASNVNLAEAARASERALELAPNLTSSHISSGIVCCMNQEYAKAEVEFENAIRLNPKKYEAWYFFGRTKVHEGDLERALKLFERASRVRPEDFQSVLLQAQLNTSLNKKGKALEVTREGIRRVRAVLELKPDDNRALNMGAFALLRLGQVEEAKQWMAASMESAPLDSIIQYNGACFFSLAGDTEHALDCLENCIIKVGNINREWLEHDSDLDNIRNHPRYHEIIRTFPE